VVYNWASPAFGRALAAIISWIDQQLLHRRPNSINRRLVFLPHHHVFSSGNLVDLDKDGKLNWQPVAEADYTDKGESRRLCKRRGEIRRLRLTVDRDDAYEKVMRAVGCSLHRDAVDLR